MGTPKSIAKSSSLPLPTMALAIPPPGSPTGAGSLVKKFLVIISVLFFILGYLIWNGGKDITWNFFTKLPAPVGEPGGGMANAIVGSGKLLLLAMLFGVPIGVLGGVYLAEFGGRTFGFLVRYTTDLLNGVPSIIIGIFAYAVVVVPMHRF